MDFKKCLLAVGVMLFSSASLAAADNTVTLLKNLTNASAPSGFEGPVRDIILPIWQRYITGVKVDGVGNVLGLLPGEAKTPRILLMSHMDEVGFLIRGITEDGFLEVEPLGTIPDQASYAQRWVTQTVKGRVVGYNGMESGHIVPKTGETPLLLSRNTHIDVGATNEADAVFRLGLRPGLAMAPDTQFEELNGSGRYLAKAIDDRAGVALVTDYLERYAAQKRPNLTAVTATVQEELGLRGARVIYNEFKPDVVINLEACIAGDHPLNLAPKATYPALGKGPCIYVYERSMMPNNKLVDWIAKIASENNIPFQYATAVNYGQDGSVLQGEGEGMPVVNIGIPVRYAHQQSGIMQRSDYDAALQLLNAIMKNLDEKQVKIIRSF